MVSSVVAAVVGAGLGCRRAEGNSMAMAENEGGVVGEGNERVSNEKDREGKVSFYTPGGVPWHGRTPTRGARSLLPWSILSNEPSTVGRVEFLCVSQFSQSRNVPHFREVLGVEMGSSSHRRGSRDKVKGGKHGTCHECSRTVGGRVCM